MSILIREARRDREGCITVSGPQKYGSVEDWIDYWVGWPGMGQETQQYQGLSITWYGNTGYVIDGENA